MQGNIRDIGNFLQVDENQTINYNKDIVMSDLAKNSKVIVKCYCTIVAGQSISHYMKVEDFEIFTSQKELIQAEIDKFKEEAIRIATEHNVPII